MEYVRAYLMTKLHVINGPCNLMMIPRFYSHSYKNSFKSYAKQKQTTEKGYIKQVTPS
jgi:hypothetical protein